MRKNRSGAVDFPIATVVGVNLIIDQINNRQRGAQSECRSCGLARRGEEGVDFAIKKKTKKKKIGAPTASNSISVMRERVINRVEIEERRVSALFVLVCVSRCSLVRKEMGERREKTWKER